MKKLNKVILMILIYIGLIFINTNVLATSGKTTESTTRMRESASTESGTVTLVSGGESVDIVSEEGEWYKVNYTTNGKTISGYIRKDMLSVEGQVSEPVTTDSGNESNTENNVSNPVNTETEENNTSDTNNLQEGYQGTINNKVDIKIIPTINSSVINAIDSNTEIKIIEIMNKWCHIETDSKSGWILIKQLESSINKHQEVETNTEDTKEEEPKEEEETEKKETASVEKKILYVSTETLNVRESADSNAKIVKQLSINDTVNLVEKVDNTWSKVEKGEVTGYVASKYLSEEKTEITSRSLATPRTEVEENKDEKVENTTNNSSSGTGSDIVNLAKQYLGYKYVSGGASPSAGFDCSGFTYYVYKQFGITLNRASGAQASNGTEVQKSDLQLGDLVLFKGWTTSSIGHVGIYIGGNTFIHAANAQKGVITTSMSDSYYSSKYVTARRVIK